MVSVYHALGKQHGLRHPRCAGCSLKLPAQTTFVGNLDSGWFCLDCRPRTPQRTCQVCRVQYRRHFLIEGKRICMQCVYRDPELRRRCPTCDTPAPIFPGQLECRFCRLRQPCASCGRRGSRHTHCLFCQASFVIRSALDGRPELHPLRDLLLDRVETQWKSYAGPKAEILAELGRRGIDLDWIDELQVLNRAYLCSQLTEAGLLREDELSNPAVTARWLARQDLTDIGEPERVAFMRYARWRAMVRDRRRYDRGRTAAGRHRKTELTYIIRFLRRLQAEDLSLRTIRSTQLRLTNVEQSILAPFLRWCTRERLANLKINVRGDAGNRAAESQQEQEANVRRLIVDDSLTLFGRAAGLLVYCGLRLPHLRMIRTVDVSAQGVRIGSEFYPLSRQIANVVLELAQSQAERIWLFSGRIRSKPASPSMFHNHFLRAGIRPRRAHNAVFRIVSQRFLWLVCLTGVLGMSRDSIAKWRNISGRWSEYVRGKATVIRAVAP